MVRHKSSVRWAWSLNAASSVLGSGAVILFALYLLAWSGSGRRSGRKIP